MISKSEHKQVIHQIVYRLSELGLSQQDIARATGYTQGNISHILGKMNAIEDQQAYTVEHSPGRPAELNEDQLHLLDQKLQAGAKAAGFPSAGWSRRRVHHYIKARFQVDYSMPHISRLMTQLGYSLQQPQLKDTRRSRQQEAYYEKVVLPQLKKS